MNAFLMKMLQVSQEKVTIFDSQSQNVQPTSKTATLPTLNKKKEADQLINIYCFKTTMKIKCVKNAESVIHYLRQNPLGLRQHHWDEQTIDFVCPFFIFGKDPKYTPSGDIIANLNITSGLQEELQSSEVEAVPTKIKQRKTKNAKEKKVITTQVYALEILVQHQPNLISINNPLLLQYMIQK